MKTLLNRREAWVKIRDAFAQFADSGQKNKYTATGMCYAIDELHFGGETDYCTAKDMHNDIRAYNPPGLDMWWWPNTVEGAANRVEWINQLLAKIDMEETK